MARTGPEPSRVRETQVVHDKQGEGGMDSRAIWGYSDSDLATALFLARRGEHSPRPELIKQRESSVQTLLYFVKIK